MIRSMTGFARAEAAEGTKKCTVEIRTVNHRFLEFNVRMPAKDFELEKRIKESFAGKVTRGYVEATMTMGNGADVKKKLVLDEDMALQFLAAAKILKEKHGVAGEPDMAAILSLKDIFKCEEDAADLEGRWRLISGALTKAVDALVAMRTAEGAALEKDLLEKLALIESSAARVMELRKAQEGDILAKLKAKIEEIAKGAEADPQRILIEAAILAERSDISEEAIRLASHIVQMRQLVEAGGPVGRKVEFMLQELNREANTMSAKSSIIDISREVVEIKSNIEKIREQAANIE